MSQLEKPTGDGQPQPTDQEQRQHGWRRTLLVALLVAALALVGAGGAGFAAGRVLASDSPVRCASWDITRCVPGLDLDAVLATLAERGFECERRQWSEEMVRLSSAADDECSLAGLRATFSSLNGRLHSLSASVRVLPDLSLTPHQEAFLSWIAVLPFVDQPASAEAASSWLSEQLANGIDDGTNIDGFDYELNYSVRGSRSGGLGLDIDAGIGGWFR